MSITSDLRMSKGGEERLVPLTESPTKNKAQLLKQHSVAQESARINPSPLSSENVQKILNSDPIKQASADLSKRVEAHGSVSQLEYDKDSRRFVVKITDPVYGVLIYQIPSQDSLDLQKHLEQITGMVLDRMD